MTGILRLSLKELKKKKFFSFLMLVVCTVATHTVISSITNAASTTYQQIIFENNMGYELDTVLHLDYQYTEETSEFAEVLAQYRAYISTLDGIKAVGMLDVTGTYFSELYDSASYQAINAGIVAGSIYEDYPAQAQLLCVDEPLLGLVVGGISAYSQSSNGCLPIYTSELFKEVLPIGMTLTDERTGTQYEIVGYVPAGSKWIDENDLIRFPLVSMDGWFIAPFTAESEADIMTQLSCLHNTYILLSDGADMDYLKQAITSYPEWHGFEATAYTLAEEYDMYHEETETFVTRQIGLAVFISLMAISSIAAVFTTNTLLKRKQYGILLANGFTQSNIAVGIATEIGVIVFSSAILSWTIKLVEFEWNIDPFRNVLLEAHIRYTLPICALIAVVLIGIATLLPAIRVFKYQPCELTGGDHHGTY